LSGRAIIAVRQAVVAAFLIISSRFCWLARFVLSSAAANAPAAARTP